MNKMKLLWGCIFILVLLNISTVGFFLTEKKTSQAFDLENFYANQSIAAIVGEEEISTEELIKQLLDIYGKNTLNEMIERRLVFSEAERLGISIAEEEVDREISYLGQEYASNEQFYEMLEQQMGISRDRLREEVLFFLLMEEMATLDIVISEEELLSYYEENKDAFYDPTRFHLHQILVESEEEANQVILEINQGSSFEAVAAERSIDLITSTYGGDMGVITSDDYFLPLAVLIVAEQIELQELSNPILTDDGYVVLKITDRIEGKQATFDEVSGKIRRELALQQIDGLTNYLARLKENVEVINNFYEE